MNCPTCNHSMQSVAVTAEAWWCPRCGTLKYRNTESATPPYLVEEILQLRERFVRDNDHEEIDRKLCGSWGLNDFKVLGIDQSLGICEE